jgi:hypothetical protein
MLSGLALMMYWANNDLPMHHLMTRDATCVNEEAGEILLSMLASVRHRSDIGKVDILSKQLKEAAMRFAIAQEWENNFQHIRRANYHRQVTKKDPEVTALVEHFRTQFVLMATTKWLHYPSKFPAEGVLRHTALRSLCTRFPLDPSIARGKAAGRPHWYKDQFQPIWRTSQLDWKTEISRVLDDTLKNVRKIAVTKEEVESVFGPGSAAGYTPTVKKRPTKRARQEADENEMEETEQERIEQSESTIEIHLRNTIDTQIFN